MPIRASAVLPFVLAVVTACAADDRRAGRQDTAILLPDGSATADVGAERTLEDIVGTFDSVATVDVGGSPDVGGSFDVFANRDATDPLPEAAADALEGPKDARAEVVPRPPFVVVLGSSTAAGFGLADPTSGWVPRYARYLATAAPGAKVTNLAVSGYSTYQIQPTGTASPAGKPAVDNAHNVTAALALHPDALIVNMPTNDAAMGVPVAQTMANLHSVAAKAGEAHVLVWITTSQPRDLPAAGLALLLGLRDRVLQDFGPRALDFFTPLAAADGKPLPAFNQGDGIHPNAEGHRLLFEQVRLADLPASLAGQPPGR